MKSGPIRKEAMMVRKTFYIERKPARPMTRGRRRGQAIVEAALVLPVLLAILIGIIEFGWLVKNNHTIANATREGARFAALGKTTSDVQNRVRATSAPLTVTNSNITLQYYNNNTWTAWPPDIGSSNGVPVDSQIKVLIRVPHQQLTGFFPFLRNRIIEQFTVMRREL